MGVRTTGAAAFGPRISVLQAGHAYVSDIFLGLRQGVMPDRNKAVAIGAVSYYVDHFVIARISKFTCGSPCNAVYDPSDPDHIQRLDKSFFDATGERMVPGSFRTMLTRVRNAQFDLAFRIRSHRSAGR